MYGSSMSEYELSSLKREAEQSLREIANSVRDISTIEGNVESQVREVKLAQSSLNRAIEQKIQDVKKSAEKSSGYSSYSYSSADNNIRDADRTIERAVTKISDDVRKCSNIKRKLESSGRELGRKIERLANACEELRRQLLKTTDEIKAADRKSEDLARELNKAKHKSTQAEAANADMLRKLNDAKREKTFAGAAAAAAAANAGHADRRAEDAERELSDARRKFSKSRQCADEEIERLHRVLKMREEENELLNMLLEAAKASSKSKDETVRSESGDTDNSDCSQASEEYAELWNAVMEDGVIELSEVKKIKSWLSDHAIKGPAMQELAAWCDSILYNGQVYQSDVNALYDCSIRLLKSMGAKLDE